LAAMILSDQDRDLLAEVEADEAADGDGAA
jgi:hypothetical protein